MRLVQSNGLPLLQGLAIACSTMPTAQAVLRDKCDVFTRRDIERTLSQREPK